MIKFSFRCRLIAALLLTCTALMAHADDYDAYFSLEELPNSLAYLPPPPDTTSAVFAGDYAQWMWGKSVRNTPRGEQASWETRYGPERMCDVFGEAMGITLSEEETPAIYKLIVCAGATASRGVIHMKTGYHRRRPFVVMNEKVWGQFDRDGELRPSSSYPSSHTALGWGVALALAEMAPHLQDTILRRGYEYGQSRVITGAHWQSDVDAARLCASAAISRAHDSEQYIADLAAARAEYLNKTGLTNTEISAGYPIMGRILDAPFTNDDIQFFGDVAQYWDAKGERDGERGVQAIADADLGDDQVISSFASCVDIDFSPNEAPAIIMLLKLTKLSLGLNASGMKDTWFRDRPYVHFSEQTSIPGEEREYRKDSSYPSGHAMIGWGIALVLAEVMPDCQNALLKRGYDIGWSRVITGYHYASDVQAGRIMASCALTKMHNDLSFKNLLAQAKLEYAQLKANQGLEELIVLSQENPNVWYSITGIIYNTKPEIPGIYIHNGNKVQVK